MIELWLIRHGQTEDNITKTLAGHTPGKLTNLGVRQAKKTGQFLENTQFDFAYVSDLGRTKSTYENITSKMNTQIPPNKVTLTPILREKGGGPEYEGKPLELFRKTAADRKISLRLFKGKGGENWDDVNKRAQKFLLLLAQNHLSEPIQQQEDQEEKKHNEVEKGKVKIMGVTHGGFIMEVHNTIEFLQTNSQPNLNNNAKNCSIHKIQIALKPGIKIVNPLQMTLQDLIVNCFDRNNDDHVKDVK